MLGLVSQLRLHKKRMSQGIGGPRKGDQEPERYKQRGLESAGEIIERERCRYTYLFKSTLVF